MVQDEISLYLVEPTHHIHSPRIMQSTLEKYTSS